MKTIYKLDKKRISKKELTELLGEDRVKSATRAAWCTYLEYPDELNQLWVGYGMLTIIFA